MSTVVLTQEQRNGTFGSSSLPIPDGVPQVFAGSTMSDADALDAGKSCAIAIRFDFTGNFDWVGSDAWRTTWQGGGLDRDNNPIKPLLGISVPLDANGNRPKRVMTTMDTLGNLLNMGLTLDFPQ